MLALEGDRFGPLRLLRASKNRFGSTEEVGVFEMGEGGLAEVADPARAFLGEHAEPAPGSVVGATLEGSRPILVEVQALVAPTGYGTPTRRASGLDPNRLALLIAVLGRRAGVGLGSHDVYANLAGGLALDDPGLDLPLAHRPGLVAARPAGRAPGRSPSARSACSASCEPSRASSAGCARPPGSGSGGRSCPAGAVREGARDRSADLEIVPAGTLREALAAALDGAAVTGRGG